MKLASRLLIHALPLAALAGCNVPSNSQVDKDGPSLAQQACEREDMQDVVGKEVKSILYKGWFENAGVALLLIDPRELGEQFKQARASFHGVTAEGNSGGSTSMTRVVCQGILQIDESNELQGQSILQFRKLRWSIDFGQAVDDPQTSAFSIVLDRGSLTDDVHFNGEPIEAVQRGDDDDPAQSSPPSTDTQIKADADARAQAARDATNDAAARLDATEQDAKSAAEQVERELKAELAQ